MDIYKKCVKFLVVNRMNFYKKNLLLSNKLLNENYIFLTTKNNFIKY